MCLCWGTPYKAFMIEGPKKEKEKEKEKAKEKEEKKDENVQFYLVQPGDQFVPVSPFVVCFHHHLQSFPLLIHIRLIGRPCMAAFYFTTAITQQQQPSQPTVYTYIPLQNPAHPHYAAAQAANPYPGNVIGNHSMGQGNNNPDAAPVAATIQVVMQGQTAVNPAQVIPWPQQQVAVVTPQPQQFVGWAAPGAAATQQQVWFAPNPQQLQAQKETAAEAKGTNVPCQLIPYHPKTGQTWWVRHLDGTWAQRTTTDIHTKLHGQWRTSNQGVPYFEILAKFGS
ncbi:hypothetical protein ACO22_01479 [Paracoccidioides brasiliensis]|uniref:Uncharacterized protein n=1 Tax=Paracoccidioides brasiliensis TaxID=121759 RepID=A0A1D2JLT1_PARBR|nr:hypothetical protein ACO22_01479 [Paracoccidioides brasiliensis]